MLLLRRLRSDFAQAIALSVGVLMLTTVLAGAPMYLDTIESLGLRSTLIELSASNRNLQVSIDRYPLTRRSVSAATERIDVALTELGGLAVGVKQESHSRDHFWAIEPGLVSGGSSADRAILQRFEGFVEHVEMVQGRAPSGSVERSNGIAVTEAAVPAKRAAVLGVNVDDEIWLTSSAENPPYGKVLVVGLFEPHDLQEEFWFGLGHEALEPPAPSLVARHRLPLFLAGESLFDVVTGGPASIGTNRWLVQLDFEKLKRQGPATTEQQIDALSGQLRRELPEAKVISALGNRFRALREKISFARIPTLMMGGVLLLAAGYYAVMAAGVLMARRRVDTGRLWVRGTSKRQIARLFFVESLVLVLVPAALAPYVALGIISLLGQLAEYKLITFGSGMPVHMVWQAYAWSLLGAAFVLIYMQWVVWKDNGREIGGRQLSSRRVEGKPFFQRQYLDVLFFIFGGVVLWDLSTESSFVSDEVSQLVIVKPLVAFAPAIFLAVTVLALLRVLPPAARLVSSGLMRRGPAWSHLVSASLARVPITYAWPTAILGMAVGTVVLSSTIAATLQQGAVDQSGYGVGADLRISPVDFASGPRTKIVDEIRRIDGVDDVSVGLRTSGGLRAGGQGKSFEFLAIESGAFTEIGVFRNDYASSPFVSLLHELEPSSDLAPLKVPETATRVGVRLRSEVAYEYIRASLRLIDAEGRAFAVDLGAINSRDWQLRVGDVPELAVGPVEIAGLVFFEQTNSELGTRVNIQVDELVYSESLAGPDAENADHVVLESFNEPDLWQPLASSEGVDTAIAGIELSEGSGAAGETGRGLLIELGVGTNKGVRGVIRTGSSVIPAIVSTGALAANGLTIGDTTVIHVFDQSVQVRIVGVVEYFPTMDPAGGGFVITDAAQLWKYVSMSSFNSAGFLAELFVGLDDPGDGLSTSEVIESIGSAIGGIHVITSRDQIRESSVVTPLAIAGWRGISVVTSVLAIALASLGFLTFAPMRPSSDRHNVGVLRALGTRRRGMLVISVVEQLVVLLVGVLAGLATGLVMARLAVGTATQIAEEADVLPPIVFSTSWNYLLGLVGSLLIIAVVIVVIDVIAVRRINVAVSAGNLDKGG